MMAGMYNDLLPQLSAMSFESGTNYTESDADDEYDGHVVDSSPVAPSDHSGFDSEMISSSEHTPTTLYGGRGFSIDRMPESVITQWGVDDCADFVVSVGLRQYADVFIANGIVGEALVALVHDDLKSMGINSVGHRLTILKSVYDVKRSQDVHQEPDHYVPPTADSESQYNNVSFLDLAQMANQIRMRDDRVRTLEQELRRITDDFRRLREDVLPALRLAKDAQAPLPSVGGNSGGGNTNGNLNSNAASSNNSYSHQNNPVYSFETTMSPSLNGLGNASMMQRSLSTKKFAPVMAPSPSHLQTSHERSMMEDNTHLSTSNGGYAYSGQPSPSYSQNLPSPTSPPVMQQASLGPRSYRNNEPMSSTRSTFAEPEYGANDRSRDKSSRRRERNPDTPGSAGGSSGDRERSGGSTPVEIFKSFRVSLEDPCYKVLPAALRKYQINAPWEQYSLYIVYGDQERCLGPNEKPLILFKQLDKEGKKPMFMLRKTNPNAGGDGGVGMGMDGAGGQRSYDPPGGII